MSKGTLKQNKQKGKKAPHGLYQDTHLLEGADGPVHILGNPGTELY